MEAKKLLRSKIKQQLKQIKIHQHHQRSLRLAQNLSELYQKQPAESWIGGYACLSDEICWHDGPMQEWEELFSFPFIINNREMLFKKSSYQDLQERNHTGFTIKEPGVEAEAVVPHFLLVPGLAFSADGNRLGRGKGFYDCYLQSFQGLKVGVCFQEQVQDEVPVEDYDQTVDYVVTDEICLKIKG